MFLRGRQPESTVWPRFRAAGESFSVRRVGDLVEAAVRTSASRAVDLFLALIEELPPAVAVTIEDVRSDGMWSGEALALPDVIEVMGRLKLPLTTFAGAEIAVVSADEQVTLTRELGLYCFAHTERWVYLLRGLGLTERASTSPRSWHLRPEQFPPARELTGALAVAADRLKLIRA